MISLPDNINNEYVQDYLEHSDLSGIKNSERLLNEDKKRTSYITYDSSKIVNKIQSYTNDKVKDHKIMNIEKKFSIHDIENIDLNTNSKDKEKDKDLEIKDTYSKNIKLDNSISRSRSNLFKSKEKYYSYHFLKSLDINSLRDFIINYNELSTSIDEISTIELIFTHFSKDHHLLSKDKLKKMLMEIPFIKKMSNIMYFNKDKNFKEFDKEIKINNKKTNLSLLNKRNSNITEFYSENLKNLNPTDIFTTEKEFFIDNILSKFFKILTNDVYRKIENILIQVIKDKDINNKNSSNKNNKFHVLENSKHELNFFNFLSLIIILSNCVYKLDDPIMSLKEFVTNEIKKIKISNELDVYIKDIHKIINSKYKLMKNEVVLARELINSIFKIYSVNCQKENKDVLSLNSVKKMLNDFEIYPSIINSINLNLIINGVIDYTNHNENDYSIIKDKVSQSNVKNSKLFDFKCFENLMIVIAYKLNQFISGISDLSSKEYEEDFNSNNFIKKSIIMKNASSINKNLIDNRKNTGIINKYKQNLVFNDAESFIYLIERIVSCNYVKFEILEKNLM